MKKSLCSFAVLLTLTCVLGQASNADAAQTSPQNLAAPSSNTTATSPGKTSSQDLYQAYFGQVMRDVRKHWYAAKSQWKPEKPASGALATSLAFKVSRDGSISDIRVRQPSSNPDFDTFVVQTLQETAKVTPIPATIPQESIDCLYTAHYDVK